MAITCSASCNVPSPATTNAEPSYQLAAARTAACTSQLARKGGDARISGHGKGLASSEAAVELGAVFAAHCAAALATAISREGLEAALASRDQIGQAKDLRMAHHQLSATEAFELARTAAQDLNVELRETTQAAHGKPSNVCSRGHSQVPASS